MAKLIINKGEKKFFEVTNENINGILLSVQTDEAVTAFNEDFASLDIKIQLKKDGKTLYDIFNGTMQDYYQLLSANNYDLAVKNSNTDSGLDSYMVKLETGHQNLKNGLSLFVEIENGLFSADATTSVITVESLPTLGVASFVPTIEKIQLDSTQTQHTLNLGNFVDSVVLVAENALDTYSIDSLTTSSDKYNAEDSHATLIGPRFLIDESTTSYNNAMPLGLLPKTNHLFNDLRMVLKFDSAYANRVVYVVRKIMPSKLVSKFVSTSQAHASENMERLQKMNY
jgi:hypothetical protein